MYMREFVAKQLRIDDNLKKGNYEPYAFHAHFVFVDASQIQVFSTEYSKIFVCFLLHVTLRSRNVVR